jgi:hypothetical protein
MRRTNNKQQEETTRRNNNTQHATYNKQHITTTWDAVA